MWGLEAFDGASPAAQLFGAVFFGVMFLRLLRYVLSVLGLGS